MVIKYQDSSLQVSYIQIFLREYFGLSVESAYNRETDSYDYFVTGSTPIRVTGHHEIQTYTSIALWMAYNYPNEKFPQVWSKSNGEWICEDNSLVPESPDYREQVKNIIVNNLNYFTDNHDVIQIPERVLSYIFNEVVTPISAPEEILRVKKLVYFNEKFPDTTALKYTDVFMDKVKEIQETYLSSYENTPSQIPRQFKDFKVTGYVDPWTEIIIKKGLEENDV